MDRGVSARSAWVGSAQERGSRTLGIEVRCQLPPSNGTALDRAAQRPPKPACQTLSGCARQRPDCRWPVSVAEPVVRQSGAVGQSARTANRMTEAGLMLSHFAKL